MAKKIPGRKKETAEHRAERELVITFIMQDVYVSHEETEEKTGVKMHSSTFRARKKEAKRRLEEQEKKIAVQFNKLAEENPGFDALANFSENYVNIMDSSIKSWHDWWNNYRESGKMSVDDMAVYQDALLKLLLIMKSGNDNSKK